MVSFFASKTTSSFVLGTITAQTGHYMANRHSTNSIYNYKIIDIIVVYIKLSDATNRAATAKKSLSALKPPKGELARRAAKFDAPKIPQYPAFGIGDLGS